MLSVSDEVRELISSRATDLAIRNAARRAGMRTLLEDGIAKAAQGLTTLEEVLLVSSGVEEPAAADEPPTVAAPAAAAPALPMTAAAAPAAAAVTAPADPERRRRVLVVEDNATISSVVKYFLELEGFDVTVAGDGRAGLDIALREPPDLIVSDVRMPSMTGTEMVKQLRSDAGYRAYANSDADV